MTPPDTPTGKSPMRAAAEEAGTLFELAPFAVDQLEKIIRSTVAAEQRGTEQKPVAWRTFYSNNDGDFYSYSSTASDGAEPLYAQRGTGLPPDAIAKAKEIKARAEKATAGPWEYLPNPILPENYGSVKTATGKTTADDGRFIASVDPTTAIELCDLLLSAAPSPAGDETCAKLRDALKQIGSGSCPQVVSSHAEELSVRMKMARDALAASPAPESAAPSTEARDAT